MDKAHLYAAVLAIAAGSAVPAVSEETPEGAAETPRNVILIGWDGAGRSNIKAMLEAGELPALATIAEKGSIVAIDVLRTTDTKAGWSQILTGYEPETTGVFSNGRYRAIPEGYTVFERLEKHFGDVNIVTGAVIGKKKNIDHDPPQNKILPSVPKHFKAFSPYREKNVVVEGGVAYQVVNGKPYYHTSRNVDVFVNGLMKDKMVGKKALEMLETHAEDRFFFFFHFAEVDHKGHHKGEGTPQYHDAILSADLWTGKIMNKLEKMGIADETLVYVTADHGFDVGMQRHKDAPYVWLATNDPLVQRRGLREDIAPTILDRFGIDLEAIDPPLDGHPLTAPLSAPIW